MPAPAGSRRILVWDLAIRLFHWLLVLLIAAAWATQEQLEDSERHALVGYLILTLLLFRLFWGLVGSDTARFSSFIRGPVLDAAGHSYCPRVQLSKGWHGPSFRPLWSNAISGQLGEEGDGGAWWGQERPLEVCVGGAPGSAEPPGDIWSSSPFTCWCWW